MTYNLKDEGDHWEERFYHHISPLFPYYEEFWQAVVVPSTRRAADGHLGPCIGLNKDFELVLMAHYSAYFHFGTAFELMDASDKSYSMSWTPHSFSLTLMSGQAYNIHRARRLSYWSNRFIKSLNGVNQNERK